MFKFLKKEGEPKIERPLTRSYAAVTRLQNQHAFATYKFTLMAGDCFQPTQELLWYFPQSVKKDDLGQSLQHAYRIVKNSGNLEEVAECFFKHHSNIGIKSVLCDWPPTFHEKFMKAGAQWGHFSKIEKICWYLHCEPGKPIDHHLLISSFNWGSMSSILNNSMEEGLSKHDFHRYFPTYNALVAKIKPLYLSQVNLSESYLDL